jgi:hypothetical protein
MRSRMEKIAMIIPAVAELETAIVVICEVFESKGEWFERVESR